MNIALMVAVGAVAFAVGFAIRGSSPSPAPAPPATPTQANNDDFTFRGNFVVYETGRDNKPYRKRPKKSVKVLYQNPRGSQKGTVDFENWTERKVTIEFSNGPFSSDTFELPPNGSTGPLEVLRDPGEGNEEVHAFTVKILQDDGTWLELDPGVKVRRG